MAAIADILGRRSANDFENLYTFCLARCLARPLAAHRRHFPCHWLVGMSAKDNGPIRVGSGRYVWYFTSDERCLVERLVITIDVMQMFPATRLDAIMGRLSGLPYPWCTPEDALEAMPPIQGLTAIETYLRQVQPIAVEQ
jgi:hypothetical protein